MAQPFLQRANDAVVGFVAAMQGFRAKVAGTSPSHERPKAALTRLLDLCDEGLTALAAVSFSLELIDKTSLDIVDMETRMQNETGRLAAALKDIGETVGEQHFIRKAFQDQIIPLEEASQRLAAALFPSAVQGLNKVNSQLWQVTNLQMTVYRNRMKALGGEMKPAERNKVDQKFAKLDALFGDVNQFLNELAERSLSAAQVRQRRAAVTAALKEAATLASESTAGPFARFQEILKEIASQARSLQQTLRFLRIPLFPAYEDLGPLDSCISEEQYASLTGLQTFALLNIGSRMCNVDVSGSHLLDSQFGVQIFEVYPDRIYLSASESLVQAVADSGRFVSAPAGLHKFNAGSYKQNAHGQGNLQISHSTADRRRVNIDADIDLYRDPLRHFFGEVVVNHLTGKKTDAYKVRSVLDDHGVAPLGGFEILSV